MAVVCMVAISCWPKTLRTISSPLDSEAYRNTLSAPSGSSDRMVPTSDFSGLVSSPWALASAAARLPIEPLERCMPILHFEEIKTDGACLRALPPYSMPNGLLGVFGHQAFKFRLG